MAENADPGPGAALAELVLLVAGALAGEAGYGATKLNKALFFCDHLHYKRHGAPITGAPYHRLVRGPAPRGILAVRDALVGGGDAVIQERGYLGHVQTRLLPRRPGDTSRFPPTALAMVGDVCGALRGHAHASTLGWQLAEEGEEIPYEASFLSIAPPVREDLRAATSLAAERGLTVAAGTGPARRRPGPGAPAGSPRRLRNVGYECDLAGLRDTYPRAEEVLAGVAWACARWPDGAHRIPGTRLAMLRTEWPVPALRAFLSLDGEDRVTIWAVDRVAPYAAEEDGSE